MTSDAARRASSLMHAPFLAAALVFVAVAGSEVDAAAPRIVNGVETQARPTTGALLSVNGSSFRQGCSGTLIGCETFLTAAHCVCPGDTTCTPDPAEFAVFLQHGGVFAAAAVAVHPGYDFGVQNDIAVVSLAAVTTGIPPTPLHTGADPSAGTAGEIAGYGVTSGSANDSGLLREGAILTASCGGVAPEPAHVCFEWEDPLGPVGADSGACFGDSGGPLLVDFGGGDEVTGVASGIQDGSCQPDNLAFYASVSEDATYIQSIGGADLSNTTCGALSQVGDVGTVVTTEQAISLSKDAQKCRKEIVKQSSNYVKKTFGLRQKCLDKVNKGTLTGPCPDLSTAAKLQKAIDKVDATKLAKRCTLALIAASDVAGGCAGAADANDLVTCILATGDTAVATMLDSEYADENPVGPITDADTNKCQAGIGKTMRKYALTRLKTLTKCQASQDKGKSEVCPDAKATQKLANALGKVEPGVEKSCADAQIASLDATGTFGGSCGGVTTTAGLASCSVVDHDAETDAVIGLLDDRVLPDSSSFVVPGGADSFRVTLNGIDGGSNDIDLYVKLGAPPSTTDFDFSSTSGGVFESVVVTAPTAGTWHVLVDDFSGTGVDFQLTMTTFSP